MKLSAETLRDGLASLVGLALAVVGVWLLRDGVIGWPPAAGAVVIGLYLALPRRMRTVGDTLWGFFKSYKDKSDG